MADEEETPSSGSAIGLTRPSFPGFRNMFKRLGGKKPPRYDPSKSRVWYSPCFRIVQWDGSAEEHTLDSCVEPHCDNPGDEGRHSGLREDGFDWCGRHFSSLVEGLENGAFKLWYEDGIFEGEEVERGEEVMAKGKMVLRDALYDDENSPPLPPYNFYLHEHINEMTHKEILAYKKTGEVPKRLRRRGRTKQ